MSRFLVVVPPLVGHVNPAVGLVEELRRRGHDVAWVAHETVVGPLLGEGVPVYPAGDDFLAAVVADLPERDRLKGLAAVRFLWERVLVPLAVDMVPHARKAADDFAPDVVVADQQTFAGGIVATERGLPWATSACGTAELVDPVTLMPKVGAWMRAQVDGLWAAVGSDGGAAGRGGLDPRFSPYLILEYSSRELVGEISRDLPSLAFVGPVLPRWADPVPFPWEWLDLYDTRVFVTLGTLSQGIGDRFLGVVLEAVADRPYGVVLVGMADELPEPPPNVLIRPFVPQLSLVPSMQAVLTHGGHNTVVGALAEGVPLVVAPIRDDQPIIARQVARSGSGVRVNFTRARPADVAAALDAVLYDPAYRAAAEHIGASLRDAGGAARAVDHLEALVGATGPGPAPTLAAGG
ncbi:MAG TPA: glycosyltransferase [Acidimicrobiales bacterium]|nr:glycosyltransferase [Acidimicrobiales bacterium]